MVLDIDNTLLHSVFDPYDADNTYDKYTYFDDKQTERDIYFKKRPHLDEFLNKMKKYFEIIIYTAAS